jgi:hypothetical protein
MMRNLIISLVLIFAAIIAAVILLKPKSPLREAEAAERRGEYQKAIDYYVEALHEAAQSMKLPDKNRSKIVDKQQWYAEVGEYLAWASAPAAAPPADVSKIVVAMSRCTSFVEKNQLTTDDSVAVYTDTTEYRMHDDWRHAFFPAGVTVEGNHEALVKKARETGISIMRISSMRSYKYEGSLLDLSSWKLTDFELYPEDDVSFLVKGGKYLLICSSEVEFPDGTIWRSPQNILQIETPDTSSLKSFVLKTRVKRGE